MSETMADGDAPMRDAHIDTDDDTNGDNDGDDDDDDKTTAARRAHATNRQPSQHVQWTQRTILCRCLRESSRGCHRRATVHM